MRSTTLTQRHWCHTASMMTSHDNVNDIILDRSNLNTTTFVGFAQVSRWPGRSAVMYFLERQHRVALNDQQMPQIPLVDWDLLCGDVFVVQSIAHRVCRQLAVRCGFVYLMPIHRLDDALRQPSRWQNLQVDLPDAVGWSSSFSVPTVCRCGEIVTIPRLTADLDRSWICQFLPTNLRHDLHLKMKTSLRQHLPMNSATNVTSSSAFISSTLST